MPLVPSSSFSGHRAAVYALADGPLAGAFLSGGSDGQVVQWTLNDPDQGKVIARVGEAIFSIHLDRERNVVLVGTNSGRLLLIDLRSQTESQVFAVHQKGIFRITPAREGVLCAGGDGVLSIWCWNASDVGWRLEQQRAIPICEEKLRDIVVDDERCFVACGDGAVRLFDLETFNEVGRYTGHDGSVYSLVLHPSKPVLFSGGKDGYIRVWMTGDGSALHAFPAHKGAVYGLILDRTDDLISGGRDALVKTWSAIGLDPVARSERNRDAHTHSINALLLCDGTLLTASDDMRIRAW